MRHLPPLLFLVASVPASVGWWHFQLCFHPSEKWMTWRERYQMSCRGSQWICHWVWLLPEWIVIYLYGSLVMLTDLLPHPRPHPHHQRGDDRLSRSFGWGRGGRGEGWLVGSVGEAWQMLFGTLLNNSTTAFDLTYPLNKLFQFMASRLESISHGSWAHRCSADSPLSIACVSVCHTRFVVVVDQRSPTVLYLRATSWLLSLTKCNYSSEITCFLTLPS